MGVQKRCRIKQSAFKVDGGRMPSFMYEEDLEIVRETEKTVFVKYEHSDSIYEFNKKNIERYL